MSKETYKAGFCKAAAAQNVDPRALAKYLLAKTAEEAAPAAGDAAPAADGEPGMWEKVKAYCDAKAQQIKHVWSDDDGMLSGPSTQSAIGAILGGGIGTGLGAAVSPKGKRKTGLTAGAILGALAGATAPHIPYKDIVDSFKPRASVTPKK